MKKTICTQASLAVAAFSLSAGLGHAQTAGFGEISGTVQDASQSNVAGAQVRILNTDTGMERNVTTSGAGNYVVDFLQPGHYEVIATAQGFGAVDRKNLIVQVGQVLGLDFALPLSSVSANVEVTSAPPVLDTEKTEQSQNVDQNLVGNLPVNGRRYDNFVLLTPNVAPDGNSGLISFRGVSGIYNSNLVDGANNNQAFFSEARGRGIGAPYVFSQDSISEFQAETSAYSPEFGQAAGGVINAVTKSGTNQTHGDLFYYLRYPSLNALDPYNKSQYFITHNPLLLTQPVHQQQQFGGSVGGPILRDKLFYFFTYDGFRRVAPIFYTSTTTPTALAGFSCNPTNLPDGATLVTDAQCAAAKNYIVGLQNSYPRTTKQDIFFPKLDWQVNQANHVSADFNFENYNLPNGYNTSTSVNNGSVTQNGTSNFHERFLIVNFNSVVNNHSDNEVRFQWARDLETATSNSPGPSVSISGLTAYGETSALPRPAFPDEHRWQAEDVYTTTYGKHTLKAGVDLNFIHELIINLFQGDGGYSYSGATATAFANWAQDVYGLNGGQHYTSFTQVHDPITGVGKDDFWNQDLAGFLQDSFKVRPNLLVNLGVRYDVQLVPQPARPNTSSDVANLYTSTINLDYHEFQPRVGFSWQPNAGTVVRGGYGLVYGLTSNSTYYTMRVENGVFQQQYNTKTETPGSGTYESWAPHAPNVLFTPPGPALAPPFAGAATSQAIDTNPPLGTLSARGLDPHFLNPYSHSFDVAVQQELPLHSSLTVSYVGNRAMRLPIFIDTNVAPATGTRSYDVINAQGVTQQTVTVPFYTARQATTTGSVLTGFSGVNSWYNAMAVTLDKRLDHGLQVLVNYTWAKSIDGGQVSGTNGTFNGTDVPLDPFNRKAEYSRSDLDLRNRFVGSIVYAPRVTVENRYARYAANGWSLSGTATEQTGFPLTAFMSNSPTGGVPGDGGLTGAEVSLNNSGTGGRVPQYGRNAFPGPGLRNVDARVSRDIVLHDNIRMQVFAEAFNIANAQNRLGVNSTAFTWVAAGSATCPTSGHANSCIEPYTAAGGIPFGATTNTTSTLYTPRQLQFTAKLFF